MPPVEAVLDALLEPAFLLDGAGRVETANRAARDRWGPWIIGQSHVGVLRQPGLLASVEAALATGADGEARFLHSTAEVETLFDVRISCLGVVGARQVLLVFRDASEARAGQSMRRDFVANVSHELRTPLTAVMGFIETLQGPARDDARAQARFLALMAQETSRMNRLVSDLLSLSRLEAQSRRRPTERTDVIAVLRAAVEPLRPGAEAEGVRIRVSGPAEAPVRGDRDQLVQVAANLVENALKYGARPGEIEIETTRIAREPVIRGPAWRISVRDHGAGIAPEHIPRLTERFYRVDTGRSRAEGGTGLGLAIVKHIVNRHRGRLKIESTVGQGTEIAVMLPADI